MCSGDAEEMADDTIAATAQVKVTAPTAKHLYALHLKRVALRRTWRNNEIIFIKSQSIEYMDFKHSL